MYYNEEILSVFVKTAAVIASVAGIAYVVKQVLDKKAENDLFDDFDEDFEDDFEDDEDEACDAAEETAEAEMRLRRHQYRFCRRRKQKTQKHRLRLLNKNYLYKIFKGVHPQMRTHSLRFNNKKS